MPISSGGEGHVGLGVDRSIKWMPEGWKDEDGLRNSNSYLQRYLKGHAGNMTIKPEEQSNTKTQKGGMPKSEEKQVSKVENSDINHKQHQMKIKQGHDGQCDTHIKSKQNATDPSPVKASRKKQAKSEAEAPSKKSSTCVIL